MVDRWILIDDVNHTVHPEGFTSEKEAWRAQVELARAANRSPYEWTSHKVSFSVN